MGLAGIKFNDFFMMMKKKSLAFYVYQFYAPKVFATFQLQGFMRLLQTLTSVI